MAILFASCTPSAEHTVCFFGSSVCKGVGADTLQGYADCVGRLLPSGWQAVNISVGGNNTYDLLARYEADLLPTQAKYVVIGLSLGNEGLHEKGERALLSYRENMPRLIDMLQRDGRTVIVTNNYSRADFNPVDYSDLCTVNLEVQQWDVTTINLFGTIDDGAGHWADGYWDGTDIYHPNTRGHKAFASAFPISMWQALDKGKPLPEKISTDGDKNNVHCVSFTPESGLESYTLCYESDGEFHYEVFAGAQRQGELLPASFRICGNNIHQLMFYRSAMTLREIDAVRSGKMLRSSLELYCPLLEGNPANYAQTMNTITTN